MKYNTNNLKYGVADPSSSKLIAAFDDQTAATQFHSTLQSSGQWSGKNLQVIDITTGEPVSDLTRQADRVS